MLSSKNNPCVGFDSKWEIKKVSSVGSSQTAELKVADVSSDTNDRLEHETQTTKIDPEQVQDPDMDNLAKWLSDIYPTVKKNLNDAIHSKAFSGYMQMDELANADATLTQTLSIVRRGDEDKNVRIHALSWNKTGNTLAVSSSAVHKNWCYHEAKICIYTFKRDDSFSDNPNKILKTRSCVMSLKFHPTLPSVFSAGLFSGEVQIWNIQYDGDEAMIIQVNAHQERITEMLWIQDITATNTFLLATATLDGFLSLWNFSLPSSSLTIQEKYCIKTPVLARIQRMTKESEELSEKIVRGILSFDFSPYVPDMFVVGVEGGLVVQCSLLGAHRLQESTESVPVLDPVFKYYEPHEGEIHTVRFSPNRKEMFLTCASDEEIRIYLIGQDSPAQVIFLEKPLYHVEWVPYQEKLLVGCGEKGRIELFHLISGRPIANVSTKTPTHSTGLHVEVNKRRCNIAAIGNDRGEVQLWNVPWSLFALKK